ncbi:MAG: hypothetical protein WBN76_06475 [Azonexus sp.]
MSDTSRLTASVRIESIRRTTGWLYSSSVADRLFQSISPVSISCRMPSIDSS